MKPGFPIAQNRTGPRVRLFCEESRMKCANDTNLDRKSGVALWSDLRFRGTFPGDVSTQLAETPWAHNLEKAGRTE